MNTYNNWFLVCMALILAFIVMLLGFAMGQQASSDNGSECFITQGMCIHASKSRKMMWWLRILERWQGEKKKKNKCDFTAI